MACNTFDPDPSLKLTFSVDTLRFDTVFTGMGSATRRVTLYNNNSTELIVHTAFLKKGKFFHVNIDGEANLDSIADIHLAPGDSLFVFVKVNIDPNNDNSPVLVEDELVIQTNSLQTLYLEACGQNVTILRQHQVLSTQTLTDKKPYLIYDYLVVDTLASLNIQPGARLYLHDGAQIVVYGSITAEGTLEKPITFRGDRLDDIYDSIPYHYVSGKWGGIFLMNDGATPATWKFDHCDILSGTIGLYAYGDNPAKCPNLQLINSRVHNFSQYGICLMNTNSTIANCEISNCASYCAYLQGGQHNFIHNTIASYFGSTYYRIQNTKKDTLSAVFINNLSKSYAKTDVYFANNIITGVQRNNIRLATPLPQYYSGRIEHNFLKADTCKLIAFADNVYAQDTDSALFVNTYYDKDYTYYNFELDSLSPARGIADPAVTALYPLDRLGRTRKTDTPDAGCYEYTE